MSWWKNVIEFLAPDRCLVCGTEGDFLCPVHDRFVAPPPNRACFKYLDDCFAATSYDHSHSKALIQALKFQKIDRIGPLMARELIACVPDEMFWDGKVLVPIPLHPSRKRDRGFNQAEVLARFLQHYDPSLNIDILSFRRIRKTAQQARLSKAERARNLKGAFEWQGPKPPSQIILIDDVVASGHTLDAAAQVLKKSGAKKVYGLVFARGG